MIKTDEKLMRIGVFSYEKGIDFIFEVVVGYV